VVRHRQQVHRLGDPAAVAGALEDRERLVVVRDPRVRLLAVDVPVPDAVEAARDERRVADRPRDLQRLAAVGSAPSSAQSPPRT
jgi:hypothetical protein